MSQIIRNSSLEERSLHQIQSAKQNSTSSSEEQVRCSNAGRIAGIVAIVAVALFAVIMTCVYAPVVAAILVSVVIIGVAIGLVYSVDGYSRGVIFVDRGPSYIPWRRPVNVLHTPVYHTPVYPRHVNLPLFPRARPVVPFVTPVITRPVHPILPRPIISAAPVYTRPVAPVFSRPVFPAAPIMHRAPAHVAFGGGHVAFGGGLAPGRVSHHAAVGTNFTPHRFRQ